jgi:WD40 repeat protein
MSDDGSSDKRIREYSLSTPYVISSASTTSNYLYHAKANVRGVDFNSDGTKIFLSGVSDRKVYQYNLASPYTLSSSQGTTADAEYHVVSVISGGMYSIAFSNDGTKLFILETNGNTVKQFSTTTTGLGYGTGETWVNGTNNNEHATLQQALTSQAFNRMDKAQLDAVADGYHFSQDSADTLDLMIAPYAASGTSPISDGVTINYDAASKYKQAIHGTEYDVEFTTTNSVDLTSKISANLKARVL